VVIGGGRSSRRRACGRHGMDMAGKKSAHATAPPPAPYGTIEVISIRHRCAPWCRKVYEAGIRLRVGNEDTGDKGIHGRHLGCRRQSYPAAAPVGGGALKEQTQRAGTWFLSLSARHSLRQAVGALRTTLSNALYRPFASLRSTRHDTPLLDETTLAARVFLLNGSALAHQIAARPPRRERPRRSAIRHRPLFPRSSATRRRMTAPGRRQGRRAYRRCRNAACP
jgi:hypothetical protein